MKTKTRVLALLMTLAMILSSLVFVVPASADEAADAPEFTVPASDGNPWTNYAASAFAGGDGSKENPYQIATAEQLALLAKIHAGADYAAYNTKAYKLTADIDLAGHEWVTIGGTRGVSDRFMGDFDGGIYDGDGNLTGKYTIKNLTVTTGTISDKNQYFSLFGYAAGSSGGTLRNFDITGSITGVTITFRNADHSGVALVVGKLGGGKKLINVEATGLVEAIGDCTHPKIAGLVALSHTSTIENCVMNGTVRAIAGTTGSYRQLLVGGILCANTKGATILNTVNNARVEICGDGTANCMAGGFIAATACVGDNDYAEANGANVAILIENCINNGTVTYTKADHYAKGSSHNWRMGGFIGTAGRSVWGGGAKWGKVTIRNCINLGAVGTDVEKGGSSYYAPFVGNYENTSETKADGSTHLITLDGLYIPVWYDANSQSHLEPYTYTKKTFAMGANASSDYRLAIDATVEDGEAIIRISKDAVETYLACGFTMTITYGEQTITWTKVPEGTPVYNNEAYEITTTEEDAEPTMTMTRQLNGETIVHEADVATWADFYTEPFSGSGTEDDPFVIDTAEKLAYLSDYVANFKGTYQKFFQIDGEIDLSAHEWLPIGLTHSNADKNNSFAACGTIYGTEGSVIKNVRLTADRYNYTQSFFGYSNWIIKDLTFDGMEIAATQNMNSQITASTGVVGAMYGNGMERVTVTNLDMYGVATGYNAALVGYLGVKNGYVTDCYAEGIMDLTTNYTARIGGLVGRARYGTVTGCTSSIALYVTHDAGAPDVAFNADIAIGGIVGRFEPNAVSEGTAEENTTITGCLFDGAIYADSLTPALSVGVGGIVGIAHASGKIAGDLELKSNKVYADLAVAPEALITTADVGGLVGRMRAALATVEENVVLTNAALYGSITEDTTATEAENVAVNATPDLLNNVVTRVDVTGMNFYASISKEAYDVISELYEIEIGFILIHADDLANGNFDNAKTLVYNAADFATEGFNGFVLTTDTEYVFGMTLAGILDSNRDFLVVAYADVITDDGAELVFVDLTEDFISLADAANAALNDTAAEADDTYVNYVEDGVWSKWSKTQRETLESYIPEEYEAPEAVIIPEAPTAPEEIAPAPEAPEGEDPEGEDPEGGTPEGGNGSGEDPEGGSGEDPEGGSGDASVEA